MPNSTCQNRAKICSKGSVNDKKWQCISLECQRIVGRAEMGRSAVAVPPPPLADRWAAEMGLSAEAVLLSACSAAAEMGLSAAAMLPLPSASSGAAEMGRSSTFIIFVTDNEFVPDVKQKA